MRVPPMLLLLLAACVRPPASPPPAPPDIAPPQQRPPRFGCDTNGPSYRAYDYAIVLHDSGMPGQTFMLPPGRLLRLDGHELYFFDLTRPILQTAGEPIDEPPGHAARTVLELPPLTHPGFASSDPLGYLWRQEDLSITDHVLCMDLHDRPDDPTLTYNLRIDLTTRTLERHLVRELADAHGAGHEAVRPRLCTPAGPSAAASDHGKCVYVGWGDVIPLRRPAAREPAEK